MKQSRIAIMAATLVVSAFGAGRAATVAVIPPAARIKKDRPRLLLRPKATPHAVSLGQLKAIPRDAEFKQMLAQLRKRKSADAQAMVHLLTGEKEAAEKAIARMRAYTAPAKPNAFHVFFGLREMALAYDWLHGYPGMTKEIKAEVRRKMAPLAAAGGRIGDDHLFHNYVWMCNSGMMLWALATLGDDPQAEKLFATVQGRFNDRLFPAMQYLDGMPGDAQGYWYLYCLNTGTQALLGAQSAFEADLVGTVKKNGGNWLGRQLDGLMLSTLPDTRYIPWGDMQRGPDGAVSHEMAGIIDAATWALKSPGGAHFSKWLAAERGTKRFYGRTAIYYFIYTRTMKVKPAAPPLAMLAGGKHGGHFLARSAWKNDATVLGFRSADHCGSHNHFDQGSFIIYRRGLLALDSGRYKSPGGIKQETAAHNTLLFGGKGQRRVRGQWFKTVAEFKKNLEGGKRLETGGILFHKETPGWAAVAGQFAQAYDPGIVKSCVRQVLFVRPGTVAVVDHLAAPAGKELPEVSWLLHVPGKPGLAAGQATTTNGKSWLRCRAILHRGATPTMTPGLKTQLSAAHKLSDTYRVTFSYQGGPKLTLVHVLEVGDGTAPGKAAGVKAKLTAEGVEVPLGGRTFLFSSKPPFGISEK